MSVKLSSVLRGWGAGNLLSAGKIIIILDKLNKLHNDNATLTTTVKKKTELKLLRARK